MVRALGSRERYTWQEVRDVVEHWEMHSDYEPWAYALLLDEVSYQQSDASRSASTSYQAMRSEITSVLNLGTDAPLEDVILSSYRLNNPAEAKVLGELKGGALAVVLASVAVGAFALWVLWNAA